MLSLFTPRAGRFFVASVLSLAVAMSCFTTAALINPAAAVAQDEAAADETATEETSSAPKTQSQLEYFFEALGWTYTILFAIDSFLFVAILVMNFMALRREAMMPAALVQGFEAHLNEKRFQEAYEMAKADPSFLGKVLAGGMSKLSSGYDASVAAMEEAGANETMKLEHLLSYIALVGSISPMLGLLGTVDGMVVAFKEIASRETPPPPSILAKGVATALVTTLVGLWLAIPAVLVYGILKNWLQSLVSEVGSTAGTLMSRFSTMGKK
ncbi:MAG: MotA/TolQ/ExbB proton channel family protein [Pirellulales bacterium]|nr:MotA/TolQ/ExbB proton channel family protein [Pirellulales bacterium]